VKCKFKDIELSRNYTFKGGKYEIETIGLDSEAYVTGEPFIFCFSDGRSCISKDILSTLFSRVYEGYRFVVWNLKYEQGALFYYLPPAEVLAELRKYGRCDYEGYKISIIENKEVKISFGHHTRYIYDVFPYYASSLQVASNRYLDESKIESTKKFTPRYVNNHLLEIKKYCVQDALLTKKLADLFIKNLHELKLYPKKLISTGYISGQHFSTIHNPNVRRLYSEYPEVVKFAYDSYSGGMFQVFKRGKGKFWQYDINSAYPYEITKLKTLQGCELINSREVISADFGFLDCDMLISSRYSPVTVKINNLNIYPQGVIRRVITKLEYDYLISRGNEVEIRDGWYIRCRDEYPYKTEIERLYKLKAEYKGINEMQYMLVKILLNSLYGKFLQITEVWDPKKQKHFRAGMMFNPVYASYITAGTRVALCEAMDAAPDSICAAHTDSIISNKPLRLSIGAGLGDWGFVDKGKGFIVGSGIYSIGKKVHFRGFDRDINLNELIKEAHSLKIPITKTMARSWRYALFTHGNINLFEDDTKILDLNFDIKRMWGSKFDRYSLQESEPIILLK